MPILSASPPSSLPPSGAAAGDLAGTYPNPALAAIGAAAGPVGNATTTPVVGIDTKGRVTSLAGATISGVAPGGAAGGGLGGMYPNPTVNAAVLTTKGDLLTQSANGAYSRLAAGAAGAGLGVSGGVPAWVANAMRYQDRVTALGLLGSTWDLSTAASVVTPTTKLIYATGQYLYAGEIVTNIWVNVTTGGTSTAPTGFYVALWDNGTPTCLAASANKNTDTQLTAVGPAAFPLSPAFTVVTSGWYFFTALENGAFAGTALVLSSGQATPNAGLGTFGARRFCTLNANATSMAANDTGAFSATNARCLWFGWS